VPVVLLREVARLVEVAGLAADADRGVEVERELGALALRLGPDEALEARDVLELRVRVEEERGVIRVREPARVQLLQVRHEVVNPLRVEELPVLQHSLASLGQHCTLRIT
jgi:hypothetical protein